MQSINEIEPYIVRSEKRNAIDYTGKKLFNERNTQRLDVPLDDSLHKLQRELYEHVTDYVKLNFGRAKRNGRTALGLVMIMFQKLASSSTAAILSAMRTRLYRLENGLYEDEYMEYEQSDLMEDFENETEDGIDFDSYGTTPAMLEEEEMQSLRNLISEAERCQEYEEDAKATALKNLIRQFQIKENDPI